MVQFNVAQSIIGYVTGSKPFPAYSATESIQSQFGSLNQVKSYVVSNIRHSKDIFQC